MIICLRLTDFRANFYPNNKAFYAHPLCLGVCPSIIEALLVSDSVGLKYVCCSCRAMELEEELLMAKPSTMSWGCLEG